jgi:hypothetical protein
VISGCVQVLTYCKVYHKLVGISTLYVDFMESNKVFPFRLCATMTALGWLGGIRARLLRIDITMGWITA